MQQIKIFTSVEMELGALEAEMNRWLAENNIEVLNITGNIAPATPKDLDNTFGYSNVVIIVLYRVKKGP